ncbi:uncharacterized protein CANTADRAFT_26274 [Suhomyces tanzawaensis NRRL Y-17324]|uniref:Uncharacterized protein n=1 Tax=Suhomyces tanzawaensis NRRL Y-17324 TaxID=984487 RepID=A0A1E4SII1_9ASCO|nr:uncharacterized protein CANTADRAFT_26274 [Suhomyces tanzawaensis NRRL Y-17324]ODV79309.1 hypothetical protein CANTADRAFT_26274 [Suhomyces tanzawaensis NRRL Y-17324]
MALASDLFIDAIFTGAFATRSRLSFSGPGSFLGRTRICSVTIVGHYVQDVIF